MPLRDYVRGLRGAFHRNPDAEFLSLIVPAAPASHNGGASPVPQRVLRGDIPSDKLFLPDATLATLDSTVFRPMDKMTGVIRARHGTLGTPQGYSVVRVLLCANVRLVQTSTEGKHLSSVLYVGDGMFPMSGKHDVDTFEDRTINVAGAVLYNYHEEGTREGKDYDLIFQLTIPEEAEGFQLAPSLGKYILYYLCFSASDWNTGEWRKLYVDDIDIKPRDDALHAIDSLSVCSPFLMVGPHQELDLTRQPRWTQSRETILEVPCPLLRRKKEEAEGTVIVRLYTPPRELFVQRPFPLVVKLSVIAPVSYGRRDIDWPSFRLDIPTGAESEMHKVETLVQVVLPNTRGGDGILRERVAFSKTGDLIWDPVRPASDGKESLEGAWELRNGLDWSEPQLEPSSSRHAGRWASHAIVKGTINLYKAAPTIIGRFGTELAGSGLAFSPSLVLAF